MLKNNYYKSSELEDDFMSRMKSYFNPYEYNLDSSYKNNQKELEVMKSKIHNNRKNINKK